MKLTRKEIEEKVKDILQETLEVHRGQLLPGVSIENDLGADSLDCVEIIMACEEDFGIEIEENDIDKVKTVKDLVDYIEGRLNKEK